MDRKEFIHRMDQQVKLVRTEYGYTQDGMARILGLSKKTLVEIEKGRSSLGWMGAVAFTALFSESQVLSGLLGGEASDMVHALAFQDTKPVFPKTMGGRVWWIQVGQRGEYRIQQNMISRHYRVLDAQDGRVCSSFEREEIDRYLEELEEKNKMQE